MSSSGFGDQPFGDFPFGDFPEDLASTTGDVTKYLNLLTSQYKTKPKIVAWLASVLQYIADAKALVDDLNNNFDIDTAVGPQLDALGTLIGASRMVPFQPTGVPVASGQFDMIQWVVPSPSLRNSFHQEGVKPFN